jgi:hypothetical protein
MKLRRIMKIVQKLFIVGEDTNDGRKSLVRKG